ncbi:MAG: hypothetical protein WBA93_34115 [Microcoleaceae cyanobacterium]
MSNNLIEISPEILSGTLVFQIFMVLGSGECYTVSLKSELRTQNSEVRSDI